jgi:hypothetical protein
MYTSIRPTKWSSDPLVVVPILLTFFFAEQLCKFWVVICSNFILTFFSKVKTWMSFTVSMDYKLMFFSNTIINDVIVGFIYALSYST